MLKKSILLSLVIVTVLIQSCSSVRIPTIYDGKRLGAKELQIVSTKKGLVYSKKRIPKFDKWAPKTYVKKYGSLEKMMERSNTTAFLVMKDGQVLYENYFNGVHQGDITQIFSVTKVLTTTLLGIALNEGKITSLDQPVSDFIPEFKKDGLNKITLYHLAQMQSGINYDEYSNLLQTLKFYNNKHANISNIETKMKAEPGTLFKYKSIDTQLLGECIERAVGKPFLDYINEKLFAHLGFEDVVTWSIDSKENGKPKFYGGLNISARDLAKFGKLIMNNGEKDGVQILNPLTNTFCKDKSCRNMENYYCNGWWYDQWNTDADVFYGSGFRGQILMINKTDNVVIVRLGEKKGGVKWYKMLRDLSTQLNMDNLETIDGNLAVN